jgi:hypothetical protein
MTLYDLVINSYEEGTRVRGGSVCGLWLEMPGNLGNVRAMFALALRIDRMSRTRGL